MWSPMMPICWLPCNPGNEPSIHSRQVPQVLRGECLQVPEVWDFLKGVDDLTNEYGTA